MKKTTKALGTALLFTAASLLCSSSTFAARANLTPKNVDTIQEVVVEGNLYKIRVNDQWHSIEDDAIVEICRKKVRRRELLKSVGKRVVFEPVGSTEPRMTVVSCR